jgi:hypothetical protein
MVQPDRISDEDSIVLCRDIARKIEKEIKSDPTLFLYSVINEAKPILNGQLLEELKKLLQPKIPLEEIDVHISDPAFARRAVEVLDEMIRSNRINRK